MNYPQLGTPERYAYALENEGHGKLPARVGADMSALASLAGFIATRASEILPTADPALAMAYYCAMVQHAAIGNEQTFAELLAAVLPDDRLNADDIRRGDMYQTAAPYCYLESDDTLLAVDADSHAATGHRGKSVRGDVEVISSDGTRANSAELLARANMLMRASGESVELIGTDTYGNYRNSWEQVVTFKPDTHAIISAATGARFVFAPYGAGDSVVGGDSTRKAIRYRDRRATYTVGDSLFVAGSRFGFLAGGTLGTYRLHRMRTVFDGRYCIGHGSWNDTVRTAKAKRAKRATIARAEIPTLEHAAIGTMLPALLRDDFDSRGESRRVFKTGPHRVSVSHSRDLRRFVVIVTTPQETGKAKRKVRTVRSVNAAVSVATRLTQ